MDQEKTPCPLCGVLCSTAKRVAHLKHCSQRLQLNPQQLIAAAQLQQKHENERKALGLPSLKSNRPIARERGNGVQPQAVKKLKEPKNKIEADLQMAMALSASLQPPKDPELVQTTLVGNRRGRVRVTGPKKETPALILVSDEERRQKWAEKVEFLLAVSATGLSGPISEPKEKPTQRSQVCHLWHLSSQSEGEGSSDCFYVKGLFNSKEGTTAGSKLWHLSQIAGRRSLDDDCNDLCYSLEAHMEAREPSIVEEPETEILEGTDELDLDFDTGGGFCSLRVQAKSSQASSPQANGSQANSQPKSAQLSPSNEKTLKVIKTMSHEKPKNSHTTDLLHLVGNPVFSDATILTPFEEIPVHKVILFTRCPTLLESMSSTQFNLSEYSHKSVIGFLEYLYAGTIQDINGQFDLLRLAERFKQPHLLHLIKSKDIGRENEIFTDFSKNDNNSSNNLQNTCDLEIETLITRNDFENINEVNSLEKNRKTITTFPDLSTKTDSNYFYKEYIDSSRFNSTNKINTVNKILGDKPMVCPATESRNVSVNKEAQSPRKPVILKGRSISAELICSPIRRINDMKLDAHNISDPFNDSYNQWNCLLLNNSIESAECIEEPATNNSMEFESNLLSTVKKGLGGNDKLADISNIPTNSSCNHCEAYQREVINLDSDSRDMESPSKEIVSTPKKENSLSKYPSSPELFGDSSTDDSFELPKVYFNTIIKTDAIPTHSFHKKDKIGGSFKEDPLKFIENHEKENFTDLVFESHEKQQAKLAQCSNSKQESDSSAIESKLLCVNYTVNDSLDISMTEICSPQVETLTNNKDKFGINKSPTKVILDESICRDLSCGIKGNLREESYYAISLPVLKINSEKINSIEICSSPRADEELSSIPLVKVIFDEAVSEPNNSFPLSPCSSPIIPNLADRLATIQNRSPSPSRGMSPSRRNSLKRIKLKPSSPRCSNTFRQETQKSPVKSHFTALRESKDPSEYLSTILSQDLKNGISKERTCESPESSPNSPIIKSLAERLAMKHNLRSPSRNSSCKRTKLDFHSLDKSLEVGRAEQNSSANSFTWNSFQHDDMHYLSAVEVEVPTIDHISSTPKIHTSTKQWLTLINPSLPLIKLKSGEEKFKDRELSQPKKNSRVTAGKKMQMNAKQAKPVSKSQNNVITSSQAISPQKNMTQPAERQKRLNTKEKKKIEAIPTNLPVTPLPNYLAMVTPKLKEALKRFGVKGMPRKKAVPLLNHIYHQTHPGVLKTAYSQKPSVSTERESSSSDKTPLLSTPETSSSKSSMESDFGEDEVASQPAPVGLHDSLKNFILTNEELHEKILFYEPLSVPEFMTKLHEAGLRPTLPILYNFFDEQGITFSNPRENHSNRKTKVSPKKKKLSRKKPS